MKIERENENEKLEPVSINVADSEYSPFCFIDSASINEIIINLLPIITFGVVFILFSFRRSIIPFEYTDETIVDQQETKDKLDIDYSIYNLSTLHKYLKIKFYAIRNNDPKNSLATDDKENKLNISIRYVFQKNYEVIDSNTSLTEAVSFIFDKGSLVSRPLNLFQHLVDLFDYVNIHLYMNGNFHPFDKFVFKHSCINAHTDFYFDQALLSGSILSFILIILFNPNKQADKKLKFNLVFMMIFATLSGIPHFKDNRYKLFSVFAAFLRYFLLSQIYMICSNYQSSYVYLGLFLFSLSTIYFEFTSFEKRYSITFLPYEEQKFILPEEKYMMFCHFIFAAVLIALICFVSLKEKELPVFRYRYLIVASVIIILTSFYCQIISVLNLNITNSSAIITSYFIIFYTISGLSFILFGPVSGSQYRNVEDYDTNLDVDPISDEE